MMLHNLTASLPAVTNLHIFLGKRFIISSQRKFIQTEIKPENGGFKVLIVTRAVFESTTFIL